MRVTCQVAGCSQPVPPPLADPARCIEHYLDQAEERIRDYGMKLAAQNPPDELHQPALRFVLVTAAKLATLGTQYPPDEQPLRGRLLHALLMLSDLREQLEEGPDAPPR